MTINDAIRLGICRIRMPYWAEPTCYLKLEFIQKEAGSSAFYVGPWFRLFSPVTQKGCGYPTPQDILSFNFSFDEEGWEPYIGPISDKDGSNVIVCPLAVAK